MWIATTSGGVVVFTGELGIKEKKSTAHYPCIKFQIAPNPFNRSTSIRWEIKSDRMQSTTVHLTIYDASGRQVQEMSLVGVQSMLPFVVRWDGTDRFNKRLCSGVYFIRFEIDEFAATQKVILVE